MYLLTRDVDSEGGSACEGQGAYGESLYLPCAQFCCESRTALKGKVYLKEKKEAEPKCNSKTRAHPISFCGLCLPLAPLCLTHPFSLDGTKSREPQVFTPGPEGQDEALGTVLAALGGGL